MTDVGEALSEKYIDAFEVEAKGSIELTISEFLPSGTVEGDDGKVINRHILKFKGAKKALIMNKTSAKRLARYLLSNGSRKMEDCVGIKVTLTTEERYRPIDKAKGPCTFVIPPERIKR